MAAFMPAWRPLDATHTVRLLSERPHGGRVIALGVAPSLAGRPEGARLAVGLVRRWIEGGLGVVLADGDLARPILHLTLGLPNVKGLADLLLAGDPWDSVVLPTSVPGLRLIPAGGGTPATSSQAARDRLAELCLDATSDGSALVVVVPLGTMLAEWTMEVCTDVVVLSGESESVASLFAEDEDRIRAHVGPPHAQHRPLDPIPVTRLGEPAADPRHGTSHADATAGVAATSPHEPSPEGRQAGSATSRIEDRWAEAAALLRARKEGLAAATSTPHEPPPPATPPAPTPPSRAPRSKPEPPAKAAAAPPKGPAAEPGWVHGKGLVFRPGEPKKGEPTKAEPHKAPEVREPLPERPRSAPTPAPAAPPATPPAAAPPRAPEPSRRREPHDPLATPPIMMAEWDRFGDEEEEVHRSARRRKMLVRVVAGVGGVAIVAGAVWIWMSTRALPPYEATSTALPRATIPSTTTPAVEATPADTPAAPAPSRAAVPETRAPHQRYSWSMAALGSMDAARSLVQRLQRRAPDQAFVIAPIVSNGRTLYRVLGGLAADREELARIREPLGQATGQPPGTWLVREAPLAFFLQDFDDAGGASAWIAELSRSGVPAYALVVDRDDGSRVWRVYAGAYANEAEAATLRALIDSAGIREAPLVERKGRVGG